MKNTTENPHEGHRDRVKNQFMRIDLDNFEPHVALEYLLYFAIPRKDTNEIGHKLIDHFGSLSQVFDAPLEELMKVDGIGKHAACLIKMIPSMSRVYHMDRANINGRQVISLREAERLIIPMFEGRRNEIFVALFIDNKGCSLGVSVIFEGSINQINLNYRLLVEAIIKRNASKVYIAHNHPRGLAFPSQDDIDATGKIYEALKGINVELIDHLIVDDNDYISLKEDRQLDEIKRTADQKALEIKSAIKNRFSKI